MTTTELTPDERLTAALAPPDLETLLDNTEDGEVETALPTWEISHLDHASWAARHLSARRARMAAVKALADDQRSRIDAWQAHELAGLDRDCTYFETHLRAFHERALTTDPRIKTMRLPDGSELRSQAGKVAVEITDLTAFSLWAEQNEVADEVMRMADPEPNKPIIAKLYATKAAAETDPGEYPGVTTDGEIVPGIVLVRRARTFTVAGPAT